MTAPTDDQYAQWRAIAEAATPGVWEWSEAHGPDHERHEMWSAMANLLLMAADHTDGRGSVRPSPSQRHTSPTTPPTQKGSTDD